MNTTLLLIGIGLIGIVVMMVVQNRRRDRTLEALKRQGFLPGQRWSSSLTVVTEQGSDRFAVVWPGQFRIFEARQIVGIEVIGQEMDSAQHRHKVELRLDDPDHRTIGLATLNRRDRAEQWAGEIRAWRDARIGEA